MRERGKAEVNPDMAGLMVKQLCKSEEDSRRSVAQGLRKIDGPERSVRKERKCLDTLEK